VRIESQKLLQIQSVSSPWIRLHLAAILFEISAEILWLIEFGMCSK
jgi:hypothetical protein